MSATIGNVGNTQTHEKKTHWKKVINMEVEWHTRAMNNLSNFEFMANV